MTPFLVKPKKQRNIVYRMKTKESNDSSQIRTTFPSSPFDEESVRLDFSDDEELDTGNLFLTYSSDSISSSECSSEYSSTSFDDYTDESIEDHHTPFNFPLKNC